MGVPIHPISRALSLAACQAWAITSWSSVSVRRSDNELRMMRPSAISGTKARITGDDDFVTSHYDE